MPDGVINWWNPERGYGFIGRDGGGDDLFFHISDCRPSAAIRDLNRAPVEFEEGVNPRNKRALAVNVRAFQKNGRQRTAIRAGPRIMRNEMTVLEIETGRNRPRHGSHEQRDGGCDDSRVVALIDERLAFLSRAHARFILYECGELDLDEAVSGLPCHCGWQP